MFGNWKGEIFSFVEQYVLSMGPRCKCSSTNPCVKMILECLVFLMSSSLRYTGFRKSPNRALFSNMTSSICNRKLFCSFLCSSPCMKFTSNKYWNTSAKRAHIVAIGLPMVCRKVRSPCTIIMLSIKKRPAFRKIYIWRIFVRIRVIFTKYYTCVDAAYDGLDIHVYAEILQCMFKVEKVMHKIVSIASFKLYIASQFNYTRNGTFIWFNQRRLVIVDNYIFE